MLSYALGIRIRVPVSVPLESVTGDLYHQNKYLCLDTNKDPQEQTRSNDHAVDPERILKEWIDRTFHWCAQIAWNSLADALFEIGVFNYDLIRSLRSYSGPLTMSALVNFPVTKVVTTDLSREVGVKYFKFGTHLLQDVTGAHIRTLEDELNRNGERINQRILQEWLSGGGRPVTWATLVEVLTIIEMGELAKKIKDRYIIGKTAVVKVYN